MVRLRSSTECSDGQPLAVFGEDGYSSQDDAPAGAGEAAEAETAEENPWWRFLGSTQEAGQHDDVKGLSAEKQQLLLLEGDGDVAAGKSSSGGTCGGKASLVSQEEQE